MEAPPPFKLPPPKDALQSLSAARVNARNISTATTMSKASMSDDDSTAFPPPQPSSTHSSPTRKDRANLFADYHPTTPGSKAGGFALPQSPSLPEIHALRSHVRTNSDVQGLVKRFEHLDVRDKDAESAERRKKHEAELQRARVAREEAESECKRYREECRKLRKDCEDGKDRERRITKRFEVLMDEYLSAKDQHTSQSAIYEKEVRRSRKEAFKSSSAVVKLQEELKATRVSLRASQGNLDLEKHKAQRADQETFQAQYQLAAVQEELDRLRAQLRIVEEEKAALKTMLNQEEVARVAAEGRIALPPAQEDEDLFSSPRRRLQRSPLSDDKENVPTLSTPARHKATMEAKRLEEELKYEQMRRVQVEEMIEFLELECRFQCCRCKSARHELAEEAHGDLAQTLEAILEGMKAVLGADEEAEKMDVDAAPEETPPTTAEPDVEEPQLATVDQAPATEGDADRSMTMTADTPPADSPLVQDEEPMAPHPTPAEVQQDNPLEIATEPEVAPETVPIPPSSPQTPMQQEQELPVRHPRSIRTVTTTTTIPMHFTPVSKPVQLPHQIADAENLPPATATAADGAEPVFDRAAALAAIEYRRGRAKSFASGHPVTPRKQMMEGVNIKERRDISAPALGGKVTQGGSYAKSACSVGRATGRRMV